MQLLAHPQRIGTCLSHSGRLDTWAACQTWSLTGRPGREHPSRDRQSKKSTLAQETVRWGRARQWGLVVSCWLLQESGQVYWWEAHWNPGQTFVHLHCGRHARLHSTGGRLVVLGVPQILQSKLVALVTAVPVLSGHLAHYPSIQKSLFPIYSASYILSSP